jgi:hypothetical protein
MTKSSERRAAYVWLLSGGVLLTYASLGLFGVCIPGVEELLAWMSGVAGWQFMAAAGLAIFIEGLYLVGNLFPGTTLVLLLAVLSNVSSFTTFALTIVSVFIAWCGAGIVNITLAKRALTQVAVPKHDLPLVRDRLLLTWFPAFRANYEVAQIAAGAPYKQVLFSALRVRFIASCAAGMFVLLISRIIDPTSIDNEEGFLSVLAVATIMMSVGFVSLYRLHTAAKTHESHTT